MIKTQHLQTTDVARAAAEHAVKILGHAISVRGTAVWIIAGGDSPVAAYKLIASEYGDALDWSKVIVHIGDERIVPFDRDDSNWGQIRAILFTTGPTAAIRQVPPPVHKSAEDAAGKYEDSLRDALAWTNRLDLVWLGVGDDGHTLSLAPGREDLLTTDRLVVPVHDFPKPPADRVSFTLNALKHADEAVIFAAGAAKKDALKRANDGEDLPVALASRAVDSGGGCVTWLYDSAAES